MYKRILVAVENSAADRSILAHVSGLARLTGAELLLVHVADGWAARNFDQLELRESEEMKSDRAYLESLQKELVAQGFKVQTQLALGDPATELVRTAEAQSVDLVAMSTHGHGFLGDIVHGATADRVRHLVKVPVLLLRAQQG
jgi:nucleotide-binding universal stress UspA family protein